MDEAHKKRNSQQGCSMDQTAKTNENTQIHTKIIGAIEKKKHGLKELPRN